ncbi:MAG: hypothetical protein EAZ92_10800 [Candidatus Kapaibacterium sp.]|nr:MAG: hypothetical protein EAZ92_10800 [Candidatus Kapabacteria bacterium]
MKTFSLFRTFAALASLAMTSNAAFAQEETPTAPTHKQTSIRQTTTMQNSFSALEKIHALEMDSHSQHKTPHFTLSADKLQKIAPEFVKTRTETTPSPHVRMPHLVQQKMVYTVDYAAMMPLFLKALQEQQAEIERLRTEVVLLQARTQK